MFRERAGLSIDALAEVSGVGRNTIWKAENGVNSPSVSTLTRMAEPLGVTVAEIVYANEVLGRRRAVEETATEYALAY